MQMTIEDIEEVVSIGSMSLAAALMTYLAIRLWWEQKEIRRKELVEMIERRITGCR